MKKSEKLTSLSLIREVYRILLSSGRTYAAFQEKKIFPLVESLSGRKEILDPMSGYGSLMSYCSKVGISSFGLEFNMPLYLWQVLNHPKNTILFKQCINKLHEKKRKWPRTSQLATVSDEWFPEESKSLFLGFYNIVCQILSKDTNNNKKTKEFALAFLLPFAGRLSSSVQGNMTTHVKRGGLCIYKNLVNDFEEYLSVVKNRLEAIEKISNSKKHIIILGDCRTYKFPRNYFSAMITSPPYPNHRDFSAVFIVENELIRWLVEDKAIKFNSIDGLAIGTNIVSGREKVEVRSEVVRNFLEKILHYKDPKREKASYDNKVYYIPYFSRYFFDLEQAYVNIIPSLRKNFEGYINVVNNTTRDQIVPLAQFIIEFWKRNGFNTEIFSQKESFHVGTKNPRARGFKAKHMEYIIKISRR